MSDNLLVLSVIKINLAGLPYTDVASAITDILSPYPNMTGSAYDSSNGPVLTVMEPLAVDADASDSEKMEAAKVSASQLSRDCRVRWEVIGTDGSLAAQSEFVFLTAAELENI